MKKSHPRWRLVKKILTVLSFIAVAVLRVLYAQKVRWRKWAECVVSVRLPDGDLSGMWSGTDNAPSGN